MRTSHWEAGCTLSGGYIDGWPSFSSEPPARPDTVISVNLTSDKSINKQNIADTGSELRIGLSEFEFVVGRVSTLICCAYISICLTPVLWIPKQMTNYKQRKICRRRLLGWKSWDASGGEMQENATEKYRRRGREMQQRGENAGGGGAQIGTGPV